jgi:hypothetical protein
VQGRVQIARDEHDVNVVGVVGQTGGQPARALNARFAQALFESGVFDDDGRAALQQRGDLLGVLFDDGEGDIRALHLADQARADAARAANDKVVV